MTASPTISPFELSKFRIIRLQVSPQAPSIVTETGHDSLCVHTETAERELGVR